MNDKHNNSNDNQCMNEAPSYLETKSKEPKKQQDTNYCPEHNFYGAVSPAGAAGIVTFMLVAGAAAGAL